VRIRALRLVAFGSFSGREIVFERQGAPSDALQIVYGTNEAGKSTVLRAVGGLLFGIPVQTQDAHVHRMADLRVGGVLEAADGTRLEVVRRKGKKNTLLDVAGNALDETPLRRLCGLATETTFRALFGLDHVSLREGAEALLAGRGDVGESLFDAAVGGGRGIHRVLQELEAEADALFAPLAQKRKLNEAIRAYQDARQESRLKSRSGEAWVTQTRALEDTEQERTQLTELVRARKKEQRRLERVRRLLPLVARRERFREQIAALGAVELLPADAGAARQAALLDRGQAEGDLARLDGEITEAIARREALAVPAWLDEPQAVRLAELPDRLGAYRKAAEDRLQLAGALAVLQAEGQAMAGVPPALGVAEQARVRTLAMQEATVAERHRTATRACEEVERRHRGLAEALAAPAPPRDAGPLLTLLRRIERAGDLDAKCANATRERHQLGKELARCGSALGLAAELATAEELLALAVPAAESVDRCAAELGACETRGDRLREEMATFERRRRELERRRAALEEAGEIPSPRELAAARSTRDETWRQLRTAWSERAAEAAETRAPLVADFERAAAYADGIADRLWSDADRVARAATIAGEAEQLARDRSHTEAEVVDLARRREAAVVAWRGLWRSIDFEPGAPDEMRAWLRRFAEVREIARRLELVVTDHAALEAEIRRSRAELIAALGAEAGPADRDSDLGALCDRTAAVARSLEEAARRREELGRALAAIDDELTRARGERDETQAALESWREQWADAVARLGLPPGASAAEANALLDAAVELALKTREIDSLGRRIQSIDLDATRFEDLVHSLAAALAPEPAERSPVEVAEILLARYREGMQARRDRERLDEDLRRRGEDRRGAASRKAAAEARLATLLRSAHVDHVQALEEAEQRSSEARELQRLLSESEDQILAGADGLVLEAALAETRGADAEELDGVLDALREELETLETDLQRANQNIGSIREGLRLLEQSEGTDAADAADEAQAQIARIRALAEQYARLRLGARLLGREIDRYREQHQGPVLDRAGNLLGRLTLGRYTGLRADFDEADRPVLRCVRADGTKVPVEGLSDGTRDQLYLALRLATLERQAATAEPLPLVLDDILIHFDDERAAAALAVLAEHAHLTQVVLFTHHARIVDLAERSLPRERLQVVYLDR
jgi:uncharacterized protein YhaN